MANNAASIKARLKNLTDHRGRSFQETLTYYAIERFLFRLSESEFRQQFVLKGGLLFKVWLPDLFRTTKDIDLLAVKGPTDIDEVVSIIKQICSVQDETDGITFDVNSVAGERIKKFDDYEGVKVMILAFLDSAKIRLQVDVGYGDRVFPNPEEVDYASLLGLKTPHLKMYPKETVIAEKFQAMIDLGEINSRMKDFFDVWFLFRNFKVDTISLKTAIEGTFKTRKTNIPDDLPGFFQTLVTDANKGKQWNAFRSSLHMDGLPDFAEVVSEIVSVLGRVVKEKTLVLREIGQ